MIFSVNSLLSDQQALTASAPSDNVIDIGVPGTPYDAAAPVNQDIGKGNPIPLLIQVTEDFVGATSVTATVETSADEAFTAPKELASHAVVAASLVAGKQFSLHVVPHGVDERYIRINYTVAGTATAGRVTAGITCGVQTNTTGG